MAADRPMTIDPRLTRKVSQILQDVGASVVMPSFRALRPEDIHLKDTPGDPDDLVTVVDKAAEQSIMNGLSGLVPGSAFVGEESVSENPEILSALNQSAPAWLIDPIDGTKNFARGDADFGIMLALVENGITRASWMAVPAAKPAAYLVVAERGAGTRINDRRVTLRPAITSRPRGTVHTKMMPSDTARQVDSDLRGKYEPQPSTGSAATEYSAILRGDKDFVIYYRLLPWDHSPGALAITEAGGATVHLSGEPYSPLSPNQVTISAATTELADEVRGWLTRGRNVSVSR
jgi:fructose-1,6-bisphosphatase/inositol monophosphatase family enzyme